MAAYAQTAGAPAAGAPAAGAPAAAAPAGGSAPSAGDSGSAPSAPASGSPTSLAPGAPANAPSSSTGPASAVVPTPPTSLWDGFSFGSYGRVNVGTDLRGHVSRPINIVSYGTRLDEQTYTELEVHRDDRFGAIRTRVVATLAIQGPLFHETGTFDASIAVRNLYVDARDILTRGLAFWVGSRMYRGDDAYLLNWWPLDNLNTVGGGVRYDVGDTALLQLHVGTNRLNTDYQYQTIRVAPREGFASPTVPLLNRPRFIVSAKATWWLFGRSAHAGVKLVAYGEAHALPEGVRQNPENARRELLQSDSGYVAGAQVGAYTGARNTYVNLWFRYARGLAAYGDLSVPTLRSSLQTSARAQDVVLALAGNYEIGAFGILAAAYVRSFRDADASLYGRNEYVEGTISVRPSLWFGENAGLSIEANYQAVMFNMLDPVTGQGPRTASLWRFAVMPFLTPAGRGNFTRPHLRLLYSVSIRSDGAQRLYAPDDPYAYNAVEHQLGLNCEWWFNSSYL